MQHHIASGQVGWDWRSWFKPGASSKGEGESHRAEGVYEYDYEYFLDRERRRQEYLRDEADVLDQPAEDSTLP